MTDSRGQGDVPAFSRRQQAILAGLALLLLVAVLWRGTGETTMPYDPQSATPQGTLALRLWLEEMGYSVTVHEEWSEELPPADLWIVFPGLGAHTQAEAAALADWVAAGNTLVIIGPPSQEDVLIEQFGVAERSDVGVVQRIRQLEPILPERPAQWPLLARVRGLDLAHAPLAQPVLAAAGPDEQARITAALQPWGAGRIWHLDAIHDLANATLHNEDHAALVPALLRQVSTGGHVVLSAVHLAAPLPLTQISTLRDWLWGTRPGLAILLVCGLTVLFLALQGVRLGPPVDTTPQSRRREAAEYVAAMAGLYQRGNRRTVVAQRLKQQLKRRLAQLTGVDAGLADADFLARLAEQSPALSPRQHVLLAETLRGLDAPRDDTQLLRLARTCDDLTADIAVAARGGPARETEDLAHSNQV